MLSERLLNKYPNGMYIEKHKLIQLNVEEILLNCEKTSPQALNAINRRRKKDGIQSSGIGSVTEAFNNLDQLKNEVSSTSVIDAVNAIKDHLGIKNY